MSKEYDMTFQSRDEAIFGLDRLLLPAERLTDRLQWLREAKNPQFGEQRWAHPHANNTHSLREPGFASWLQEGGKEAVDAEVAATVD
jgi:NADH-quinone oxidoreductase subunit I